MTEKTGALRGMLRSAGHKTAALLVVLLLAVLLVCGCGAGGNDASEDQSQTQTSVQEQTQDDADADADDRDAEDADDDDADADRDDDDAADGDSASNGGRSGQLDPNGSYDSRDEVALYIYTYGELPPNYITKKEARRLGWEGGGLDDYAPGKCIGGDRFGNYEGNLPDDDYRECDIDTMGARSRGAKRLVFSDDAIYYTEDHYRNFEQLYDEDGKL